MQFLLARRVRKGPVWGVRLSGRKEHHGATGAGIVVRKQDREANGEVARARAHS